MRNFVRIKRFSVLYSHYAYIDRPGYLADDLFEKHRVHVSFGDEYINNAHNYKAIFAKCPKWEAQRFENAMKDLADMMAICGYSDYEDVCVLLMPQDK